jgi:hypothetical protein
VKKRDFVLRGSPEVESRLRKRVTHALKLRKERDAGWSKSWMSALGGRHTDLGIPEASLFLVLYRHFEKAQIKALPVVMEWVRWGARKIRSLT